MEGSEIGPLPAVSIVGEQKEVVVGVKGAPTNVQIAHGSVTMSDRFGNGFRRSMGLANRIGIEFAMKGGGRSFPVDVGVVVEDVGPGSWVWVLCWLGCGWILGASAFFFYVVMVVGAAGRRALRCAFYLQHRRDICLRCCDH